MRLTWSLMLAVVISVQSLLPGLSVLELGKLPALIHHYKSHQSLNSDLSFIGFLELHYSNPEHHEQDHKEHHKLPFTNHHTSLSTACVYFVSERNFSLAVARYSIGQTNQTVYHSIVEEDIANNFWQPPREG